MKNFFWLLILSFFVLSVQNIYAQDSTSTKDSTRTDSLKTNPKANMTVLDNEKFYLFKNLIRRVFGGYGQAVKYNPRQQMFDFMESGRPQFIAPLNMFPHQSQYIYNGFSLNDHTNGMFNTRFLSADQTNDIDYALNPFALNSVIVNPVTISEKEAYTRLKYYEGDQNYSDLDILFNRDLGKDIKLQLAGFNKGYGGFFYNSRHTGVAYNTKLSYKFNKAFAGEFSWLRNHEISGMGRPEKLENFTYRSDAERFGARFFYKYDSTSNDKISLGLLYGYNFHRNRSKEDDYFSRQTSDNYRAYISADLSDSLYTLTSTFRLDNYNNHGTVFTKNFNDIILSANSVGKYHLSKSAYLEGAVEINYLNNFNPAFGFSTSFTMLHSNLITKAKAGISQRLPNPVERSISYRDYTGNKNLNPEALLSLSILEKWLLSENLYLQAELGFNEIYDEINLLDDTFQNGDKRSWLFFNGMGNYKLWLFTFSGGGQILSAQKYISPKQTLWGEATFHGSLFGGTIILDLTGFARWNSRHDLIQYDPIVNRFYRGIGKNLSYMNVGFKVVGTVGDAEIFMEMDNLLQQEITYIDGYSRTLTRVRFGVNWILWD